MISLAEIENKYNQWKKILGLGQQRCVNCHEPFFIQDLNVHKTSSILLCPQCQKLFPPFTNSFCGSCGLPVPSSMENAPRIGAIKICPHCAKNPPPWHGLAFYGLYHNELRDIILRFKFGGQLYLARLLAELLIQACHCLPSPDLLIPVPQFPSRLAKRGYNQALEICRQFARLSRLPFSCRLLSRVKEGLPQEQLSARERENNLRKAFLAKKEVKSLNIWLVDDVMTTGSTARVCVNALKSAGANTISFLCVARTPLN